MQSLLSEVDAAVWDAVVEQFWEAIIQKSGIKPPQASVKTFLQIKVVF